MSLDLTNYNAKPNKTITEHIEDLLEQLKLLLDYGYIQDSRIYKLCVEACKGHDVGKANPQFQKRINAKNKLKFNPEIEVPHNILSGFMLDKEKLKDKGKLSDEDYLLVLYAILYHHNYVTVTSYLDHEKELIEKTLRDMKVDNKISRRMRNALSGIIENEDVIRIKGILHKCDYSASAEVVCEYPADFLETALESFLDKLKNKYNSVGWNEMQQYCLDHREDNIVVVAQTGMGKTEGALHWIGDNKGFFVLPLRTAINAMYKRIKEEIIEDEKTMTRLAILHSSSLAYYIEENSKENNKIEEADELLEYEKNAKQWSIPLNITTMDQLFDFVFKYQGYELKLATLAYSKIVIDEIQMYSPDLLAYLIYGLERIYQLGGKIAIITATLPPFVQNLLYKKIDFKPKKIYFNDNTIRHSILVKEEEINAQDIYEKFEENKRNGKSNKILVVCNTIKKAREIYSQLIKLKDENIELEDEDIKLLHSRFIRKDRSRLEEGIKEFGKTYNDDKGIHEGEGIWISTSLVEASLDIDFDYLFTELQELSSLFQRFGRCNRKGKKEVIDYNCIVYTEINPKDITHGDKGFIDRTLYEISKEAITHLDGVIKESEKMDLIEKVLTTANLKNSDYMNKYNETYGLIECIRPYEIGKEEVKLRHIFSEEVIPKPIYDNYKEEIESLKEEIGNSKTSYQKIKLEEELMSYTVAIPKYEVKKYLMAVIKNQVEAGGVLRYGNKKEIRIIDCEYDSRGFVQKEYVLQTGEGEFL